MTGPYERWNALKREAREGGGPERLAKHRASGKLTARERLESLFDPGTFTEIDPFVTGSMTWWPRRRFLRWTSPFDSPVRWCS